MRGELKEKKIEKAIIKTNRFLSLFKDMGGVMKERFGGKIKIRGNSVPVKIIAIILTILIISMCVTDGIIYLITYNKMLGMNKSNMSVLSDEIYENFENMIKIQTDDLDRLSVNPGVIQALERRNTMERQSFEEDSTGSNKALGQQLSYYSNDPKSDEDIFLVDKEGVIVIDSDNQYLNNDLSHFDYVQKALKGELAMSQVYTSVITSRPVVTFVEPVKDEKGNIIGAVGKSIFTDYFSSRFDSFKFLNDGFVFIVDNSQNVIYHPVKNYINKKIGIKEIQKLSQSQNIYKTKTSGYINYIDNDKSYIGYYVTVPKLESLIVLTVDNADIQQGSNIIGMVIALATLIMVIIIVPASYFSIKRILKPMNVLIKNTSEISKGNLKVKNDIMSRDEIGQLAEAFNFMTGNIKNLLLEIRKALGSLIDINSTIKNTQRQIVINMSTVSANTQEAAADTSEVVNTINESFTSFTKIGEKITDVKDQSQQILEEANKIRDINQGGIVTIKNLKSVNSESIFKINEVNASFSELNTRLVDIKKIINFVNSISTQTHILALNASIEAARAGEYGRGFNVVAEQIKRLAQNTSEQMVKIDEIIGSINLKMNDVKSSIESVNSVSESQFNIVNKTIDDYGKTFDAVENMLLNIKNINSSIELLNKENNNIAATLNGVINNSSRFNNSIQEISLIIDNQYTQTRNMDELVSTLEETINILNSDVKVFTV